MGGRSLTATIEQGLTLHVSEYLVHLSVFLNVSANITVKHTVYTKAPF